MAFEKITTILYNDQGDKAEERTTFVENSVIPIGVPHSIDESGACVPSASATEVQASDLPEDHDICCTYKYDGNGNWTEQIVNHGPQNEPINVHHRKLTYYS